MKDKYDNTIDWLCSIDDPYERAAETRLQWGRGTSLFQFATPDGRMKKRADGYWCGCLTMTCGNPNCDPAWTEELTREIAADDLLPKHQTELRGIAFTGGIRFRQVLERMAEWQRRLDREIRGPQLAQGDAR